MKNLSEKMFFLVALVSIASASGWFPSLLAKNNNATNNNNCKKSVLKPVGFDNVVAMAANSTYGIWVVQSDNLLYNKRDMDNSFRVFNISMNNVVQLVDTGKHIAALRDDGNIIYCQHPCEKDGNWKLANKVVDKPNYLFNYMGFLGIISNNDAIGINLEQGNIGQLPDVKQTKYPYMSLEAKYAVYLDNQNQLTLIDFNGVEKKLGNGYKFGILSTNYLYAFKEQEAMTYRCKLPCTSPEQLQPFLSGKDVIMAPFKNNLLACSKGNPLVAIAEQCEN